MNALALFRYYSFLSLQLFMGLAGAILSSTVNAIETSGYVGAELRLFPEPALYTGQSDNSMSLSGYLETYQDFDDGDQRIAFTGFVRLDSEDDERSHVDVRELYWWKGFDSIELYAGVRKIFWGVTESVHLVDIINQNDAIEGIDGEDKLGQAMLQFVKPSDYGTFEAFVLPMFRERKFSGEAGRLRPSLPVLEAQYQDENEEQHIDFALRWSHYLGVWDIGLSHFSGTNRNPIFMVEADQAGAPLGLRPHYQQIEQSGVDVQATVGAWLFKGEAISIDEKDYARNTAAAVGLEYTFFTVAKTNADLGIVFEYQYDDRIGARQSQQQNDIALGARWAFNDIDGSEFLAIVSQDLDYRNRFVSVEMSRRLTDNWKIEAELGYFLAAESNTVAYELRDDDYFQFELRRYF
ncbi:MAG: hypothetical protein ACI93R_002114 [Flavobacteriales bacterium]|jgi:hypothetical protein